jgi:hypothetical protein
MLLMMVLRLVRLLPLIYINRNFTSFTFTQKSHPNKERLSFIYPKNSENPIKKVTQTETIWAILVNSSTPIKCKDILFL